ncbi:hypothetical protein ACJA23_02865 [Mycoplasma corogypsi]|uniref:hypothetical protein n=1 Tax=Mycoplasma corogypsi TaxID=2106 RepID=UPI003873803F
MKNKKHFNKWLISGATLTPLVLVAVSSTGVTGGINDSDVFASRPKKTNYLKTSFKFSNYFGLNDYLRLVPEIKEVLNINFNANTFEEAISNNNSDEKFNAFTIIKKWIDTNQAVLDLKTNEPVVINSVSRTPQQWRDNVRDVINETYLYIRDMFANNWGSWNMYKYFAASEKHNPNDRPIQIFGSNNNAIGRDANKEKVLLIERLNNPLYPKIRWWSNTFAGTARNDKQFKAVASGSTFYNVLETSRNILSDFWNTYLAKTYLNDPIPTNSRTTPTISASLHVMTNGWEYQYWNASPSIFGYQFSVIGSPVYWLSNQDERNKSYSILDGPQTTQESIKLQAFYKFITDFNSANKKITNDFDSNDLSKKLGSTLAETYKALESGDRKFTIFTNIYNATRHVKAKSVLFDSYKELFTYYKKANKDASADKANEFYAKYKDLIELKFLTTELNNKINASNSNLAYLRGTNKGNLQQMINGINQNFNNNRSPYYNVNGGITTKVKDDLNRLLNTYAKEVTNGLKNIVNDALNKVSALESGKGGFGENHVVSKSKIDELVQSFPYATSRVTDDLVFDDGISQIIPKYEEFWSSLLLAMTPTETYIDSNGMEVTKPILSGFDATNSKIKNGILEKYKLTSNSNSNYPLPQAITSAADKTDFEPLSYGDNFIDELIAKTFVISKLKENKNVLTTAQYNDFMRFIVEVEDPRDAIANYTGEHLNNGSYNGNNFEYSANGDWSVSISNTTEKSNRGYLLPVIELMKQIKAQVNESKIAKENNGVATDKYKFSDANAKNTFNETLKKSSNVIDKDNTNTDLKVLLEGTNGLPQNYNGKQAIPTKFVSDLSAATTALDGDVYLAKKLPEIEGLNNLSAEKRNQLKELAQLSADRDSLNAVASTSSELDKTLGNLATKLSELEAKIQNFDTADISGWTNDKTTPIKHNLAEYKNQLETLKGSTENLTAELLKTELERVKTSLTDTKNKLNLDLNTKKLEEIKKLVNVVGISEETKKELAIKILEAGFNTNDVDAEVAKKVTEVVEALKATFTEEAKNDTLTDSEKQELNTSIGAANTLEKVAEESKKLLAKLKESHKRELDKLKNISNKSALEEELANSNNLSDLTAVLAKAKQEDKNSLEGAKADAKAKLEALTSLTEKQRADLTAEIDKAETVKKINHETTGINKKASDLNESMKKVVDFYNGLDAKVKDNTSDNYLKATDESKKAFDNAFNAIDAVIKGATTDNNTAEKLNEALTALTEANTKLLESSKAEATKAADKTINGLDGLNSDLIERLKTNLKTYKDVEEIKTALGLADALNNNYKEVVKQINDANEFKKHNHYINSTESAKKAYDDAVEKLKTTFGLNNDNKGTDENLNIVAFENALNDAKALLNGDQTLADAKQALNDKITVSRNLNDQQKEALKTEVNGKNLVSELTDTNTGLDQKVANLEEAMKQIREAFNNTDQAVRGKTSANYNHASEVNRNKFDEALNKVSALVNNTSSEVDEAKLKETLKEFNDTKTALLASSKETAVAKVDSTINGLSSLSETLKASLKTKAKSLDDAQKIEDALKEAQALNEKYAEAIKTLKEADKTFKDSLEYKNSSPAAKQAYDEALKAAYANNGINENGLGNNQTIDLEALKTLIENSKAALDAQEYFAKQKKQANDKIDGLTNLTNDQKANFKDLIEKATTVDMLNDAQNGIVKQASDLDTKMADFKQKLAEISNLDKNSDTYRLADPSLQQDYENTLKLASEAASDDSVNPQYNGDHLAELLNNLTKAKNALTDNSNENINNFKKTIDSLTHLPIAAKDQIKNVVLVQKNLMEAKSVVELIQNTTDAAISLDHSLTKTSTYNDALEKALASDLIKFTSKDLQAELNVTKDKMKDYLDNLNNPNPAITSVDAIKNLITKSNELNDNTSVTLNKVSVEKLQAIVALAKSLELDEAQKLAAIKEIENLPTGDNLGARINEVLNKAFENSKAKAIEKLKSNEDYANLAQGEKDKLLSEINTLTKDGVVDFDKKVSDKLNDIALKLKKDVVVAKVKAQNSLTDNLKAKLEELVNSKTDPLEVSSISNSVDTLVKLTKPLIDNATAAKQITEENTDERFVNASEASKNALKEAYNDIVNSTLKLVDGKFLIDDSQLTNDNFSGKILKQTKDLNDAINNLDGKNKVLAAKNNAAQAIEKLKELVNDNSITELKTQLENANSVDKVNELITTTNELDKQATVVKEAASLLSTEQESDQYVYASDEARNDYLEAANKLNELISDLKLNTTDLTKIKKALDDLEKAKAKLDGTQNYNSNIKVNLDKIQNFDDLSPELKTTLNDQIKKSRGKAQVDKVVAKATNLSNEYGKLLKQLNEFEKYYNNAPHYKLTSKTKTKAQDTIKELRMSHNLLSNSLGNDEDILNVKLMMDNLLTQKYNMDYEQNFFNTVAISIAAVTGTILIVGLVAGIVLLRKKIKLRKQKIAS